ncbi:MAG: winged helix-turn-helix domain-containing protein [Eubacterium sp.]|nr:winged helix-turn-helix domain-containing protein [Eubacterium sp.]
MKEAAILKAIKNNPKITQKELADIIGKSDRTVKRYMDAMQEKGIIQRKNGKRNGEWQILIKY